MADAETRDPNHPHDRAHLARLRERVLSGFADDDDVAAIVEPLAEALAGEVFVVTDLRRIGSPLVHVEPGFERLTGYAPSVAVGRDLGFLLHNDTDQDAVREAREAVREGRATSVTLRNYRADGALFWCEQRHHPVRDARGRVSHLVTVLREVTDQVHALSAEAAAREALRGDGATDGPWFAYGALIDPHGHVRIIWASEGTRAVLAVEPDAVVQAGWEALVIEADRGIHAERGIALRRDGGSRRDRYRVRLAGGEITTVDDFASVSWVAQEAGIVAVHGVVRDVSEPKPRLRSSFAGVDAGTGLPTEEVVDDRLEVATRRARRQRRQVGYLALSLDHFEFVRTHMDGQRGERIVREAARRMRRSLRRSDTLARIGPADFAVVVDDLADAEAALPVVEKLLAWVARPFDDGLLRVELSASVGVAVGGGDRRFGDLRAEAVEALQRAQAQGGGHYAFSDPEVDRRLRARRAFELDLRSALVTDQFELHYQPRVRLAGGDVTGVEALVRWRHPERGLLLPADFLPQLERARLGGVLFEQVLERSLRQAARWARTGRARRVSINVAVADLERDDLVELVTHALHRVDLPPGSLEFELHEGRAQAHVLEGSLERLAALRERGVRLSLDDFGAIDTSMTRLRELPLDALKIDLSFVQRLGTIDRPGDPADLELLRAMVALGRALSLTVVAEGVETDYQRARLRAFACEEAQGYLFARPTPAGDATPATAASDADVGAEPGEADGRTSAGGSSAGGSPPGED
jgi:diguanylate cyclase (GGDEF)-like protein/PAS domain S-box-containing protein